MGCYDGGPPPFIGAVERLLSYSTEFVGSGLCSTKSLRGQDMHSLRHALALVRGVDADDGGRKFVHAVGLPESVHRG